MKKFFLLALMSLTVWGNYCNARHSSWGTWLGAAAVGLGAVAIAVACIPEDPETTLDRCRDIYNHELNRYASILKSYERAYGAKREKTIKKSLHTLKNLDRALQELTQCAHDLDKACDRITHKHSPHVLRQCTELMHVITILRERLTPLCATYDFLRTEKTYNDLYYAYQFQDDVRSHVYRHYHHKLYPFTYYKNELNTAIDDVKECRTQFDALRTRAARLHDTYLQQRISNHSDHCYQLLATLQNMYRWVRSSAEYASEQTHMELERLQREQQRLNHKINQLECDNVFLRARY